MTQQPSNWTFETFGTQWVVETDRPLLNTTKRRVMERLEQFDRVYSRFRDDSLAAKMRQEPGRHVFPDDFVPLFSLYQQLYQLTDKKVTPLVGRQLEQAGYNKEYTLQSGEIMAIPDLEEVLQWDGKRTVVTTRPVTFDVGAAGKGYAVDLIAPFIEQETGVYVIDASGDIRHRGRDFEQIGLEHPLDPSKVIGRIPLKNRSLCASAGNRRSWQGLHHIFDPITKQPVRDIVATWVIADTTLVADGVATALFFAGDPSRLLRAYSFDFVRMFADGSVDYSPGFEGELFT